MADEVVLLRLEDLCVKFIGTNSSRWIPEQLLAIPRHLICPILKTFHPFDVERFEVSGVFQTIGIDTDHLWKGFYFESWRRKSKWPEIYFKTKGISKGAECWRVCYLQRCLQDALNCHYSFSKETNYSPTKGSQNLRNVVSICGRYATYLRLYNPACIFLAENLDIFLQLAEYIEFLEVFILRDNGAYPLCRLLQVLTSKRLKSVGFCFCKVSSVQIWNRIFNSMSKRSLQKNDISYLEGQNLVASACTTTSDIITITSNTKTNNSVAEQTCNQYNHEQDNSTETRRAHSGMKQVIDNYTSNENASCDTLDGVDDVDIYDFMDNISAVSNTQENAARPTCTCSTLVRQSGGRVMQSLDIYDEVFGHCECGKAIEVPKEFSPTSEQQHGSESSRQGRVSPGMSKLESPLPSFSNLCCSLVHFELVAFWLHPDLLSLLVHTLSSWLTLETLILEDNALGFVSAPGCEFIDTLSFLRDKGRLQFLQITNNPVNNEFAILLFKKLLAAFCERCSSQSNNSRSLSKLKFSSHQVSPIALAYLGEAIRDVCVCNLSSAELLGSASSQSNFNTDNKQYKCTQADCSVLKISSEDHCVTCKSERDVRTGRTNCATTESNTFDHLPFDNVQQPQVRTHMNAEPDLCINDQEQMSVKSNEDPSEPGKKPLPIMINNNNPTAFTGIQVLKLRCAVGDEGAQFIADGLRRNSSLHSLSLANCDISPAGLAGIFQALSEVHADTTLFPVEETPWEQGRHFVLVEKSQAGNKYLKQLCVKGNRYDPGNNDSLAEMLASNNTLTELDLGTCDLRGLSETMIRALCINNTLTSLKLSRNGLGDADIFALSQVFSHPSQQTKLTKLDLSFNHISPESLLVLASSLQSIRPRKLDELKLTKKSLLSPGFHQVLLSLKSVVRNITAEYLDRATLFADYISQM